MAMKNKNVFVSAGVVFALYFSYQIYERVHAADVLAEKTLEDIVPSVAIVSPTKADPVKTISLPGNIEAWFQAPIYAQVPGYVKMWYKDYGAEVKAGDVLAEINAPTVLAQREQARADMMAQGAKFEISTLTAKRYAAMRESNAVPAQAISVKEADARVEQAKLNASLQHVKNFEAMIKFTTIVAPYDGVVISRDINVGDYVNKEGDVGGGKAGANSLFTVAEVHKMRLFVSVPESFGQFMQPGLKAEVIVPQFPHRRYEADFLTVAKGFRPSTRTAITEFVIDNEDRSLWPGSYASVKLTATLENAALLVPATALVFDEKGTQVAVVSADNKVTFKPINVTNILDSMIEVADGLTEADRIINNPSAALLEGDAVHIVPAAPGSGA